MGAAGSAVAEFVMSTSINAKVLPGRRRRKMNIMQGLSKKCMLSLVWMSVRILA